jgi:hypothetical protein
VCINPKFLSLYKQFQLYILYMYMWQPVFFLLAIKLLLLQVGVGHIGVFLKEIAPTCNKSSLIASRKNTGDNLPIFWVIVN